MTDQDLQRFEFPEPTSVEGRNKSRSIFWLGGGPGVMHELPDLTEYVANFGRQIAARGYPVFMPVMFGIPFPGRVDGSLTSSPSASTASSICLQTGNQVRSAIGSAR
jgi:hypothetical protein